MDEIMENEEVMDNTMIEIEDDESVEIEDNDGLNLTPLIVGVSMAAGAAVWHFGKKGWAKAKDKIHEIRENRKSKDRVVVEATVVEVDDDVTDKEDK